MSLAKPPDLESPPEKVLIIKPSALGDVVTAMPVLRALKRTFPAAHVSWLVSTACSPLLECDADLDEIVPFQRRRLGRAWHSADAARALMDLLRRLRRARYDWVIDMQGLFRSGFFARVTGAAVRAGFATAREGAWLFYTHRLRPGCVHTVDRNIELAAMLGLDARREDMTLSVAAEGRSFAGGFRSRPEVADKPLVALVPSTRWRTKMYPPRHWRALAGLLGGSAAVAVLGVREDAALCESIAAAGGPAAFNLAGLTSIPEMVGLIAAADGVVCCDSAAMHIAQAVGTEVVALIGPTRPERTGPLLEGQYIAASVPCQGCLRRKCGHVTCMQEIDPRAAARRVEQVLSEGSPPCPSAT